MYCSDPSLEEESQGRLEAEQTKGPRQQGNKNTTKLKRAKQQQTAPRRENTKRSCAITKLFFSLLSLRSAQKQNGPFHTCSLSLTLFFLISLSFSLFKYVHPTGGATPVTHVYAFSSISNK